MNKPGGHADDNASVKSLTFEFASLASWNIVKATRSHISRFSTVDVICTGLKSLGSDGERCWKTKAEVSHQPEHFPEAEHE